MLPDQMKSGMMKSVADEGGLTHPHRTQRSPKGLMGDEVDVGFKPFDDLCEPLTLRQTRREWVRTMT